jgi:hypothetical protein
MRVNFTTVLNPITRSLRWLSLTLMLAVGGEISLTAQTLKEPTGISATAKPEEIHVSWADNSTGESLYQVWRKEGTGGFSEVARLGQNCTDYYDTNVTPGIVYTYIVSAIYNLQSSDWSIEASATTDSRLRQPTGISATALLGTIQVS